MFHQDPPNTGYSSSPGPSEGELLWDYTTGGDVYSSPAVADGKVYIGSTDGKVYCLNADTGAWIWEYTTGHDIFSSPAVADGKVYIGSDDSKAYCLGVSLDKRISLLESSLTDALERITDLEDEKSDLTDNLAALQNDYDAHLSDYTDLDTRVSDIETLLGEGFSLSLAARAQGNHLKAVPLT